jgi:hypothetical protein
VGLHEEQVQHDAYHQGLACDDEAMVQDEGQGDDGGDRGEDDDSTMNLRCHRSSTKDPTSHPTNRPPVQQLYQWGVQSDPSKYKRGLIRGPTIPELPARSFSM